MQLGRRVPPVLISHRFRGLGPLAEEFRAGCVLNSPTLSTCLRFPHLWPANVLASNSQEPRVIVQSHPVNLPRPTSPGSVIPKHPRSVLTTPSLPFSASAPVSPPNPSFRKHRTSRLHSDHRTLSHPGLPRNTSAAQSPASLAPRHDGPRRTKPPPAPTPSHLRIPYSIPRTPTHTPRARSRWILGRVMVINPTVSPARLHVPQLARRTPVLPCTIVARTHPLACAPPHPPGASRVILPDRNTHPTGPGPSPPATIDSFLSGFLLRQRPRRRPHGSETPRTLRTQRSARPAPDMIRPPSLHGSMGHSPRSNSIPTIPHPDTRLGLVARTEPPRISLTIRKASPSPPGHSARLQQAFTLHRRIFLPHRIA
ncbi:hypothetical protein OF83DRAFT_1284247 [Amylostereum chailletii]|nr:hypothetical protein OF83DRAFT_1284247 [Amylostereum chailletii]